MTRDEVIRLAKEATNKNVLFEFPPQDIRLFERFAKLVAAAEREACAALCFQMWNKWLDSEDRSEFTRPDAEDCAAAIRARGQV